MRNLKDGLILLDERERKICALLCFTGLRISEVLGLKWEDLDFDNKKLFVSRSISHPDRNQPIVSPTKTKESERVIPLIPSLIEAIKPIGNTGYIVSGETPLSFSQQRRSMQKIVNQFDLKDFTAHDFRDTCATEWYEAGIPPFTISKILGHENAVGDAYYLMEIQEKRVAMRHIM